MLFIYNYRFYNIYSYIIKLYERMLNRFLTTIKDHTNSLKEKVTKYFKLEERNTTILTELRAGSVTFLTMGYILAVNAAILADSGGNCEFDNPFALTDLEQKCIDDLKVDLIYATAISGGISTLIMGLTANLPLALAPGMGLNAYFTYDVVGFHGTGSVSYESALLATFIEGFIFLALSVTGVRAKLMNSIPKHIKFAMTAGIGLFLAHLGLQSAEGIGLISAHTATKVTLGGCGHYNEVTSDFIFGFGTVTYCPEGTMEGATTWLGIIGFFLMSILMIYKVRGSIFIGILLITITAWFRNTNITLFPDTPDGDSRYEYFSQIVDLHSMDKTLFALFENIDLKGSQVWISLITFLYVDMLDTAGTLFSMAEYQGLLKEDGSFEGQTAGFCADAIGTIFGSLLGTSSVTTYIESGAGIEEGGRTGLTAVFISIFFFLSLIFAPLFASIPPWATGPSLIIIGALMMKTVNKIDWSNMRIAIPAFVTIILMPLTYSIAYGIIGGLMVTFVIKGADVSVYLSKKALMLCKGEQPQEEDIYEPRIEDLVTPELSINDNVELAIIED
jgi:AGZA family xanthine/uracil permease-like MFS transporter